MNLQTKSRVRFVSNPKRHSEKEQELDGHQGVLVITTTDGFYRVQWDSPNPDPDIFNLGRVFKDWELAPATEIRHHRYCGNPECGVSTGICDRLTFGSGELDNHGYWEHPCIICAAVSQKFSPSLGEVWPDPAENKIPDWAGQATPGAQLTLIRTAIWQTLENLREGITSAKKTADSIDQLLEQLKKVELHLQHRSW
jgi:hypothetical protein